MSVFLTLLELNFSGVISIVYFPENEKTGSSWLFLAQKKHEKEVDFLTKTMD